MNRDWDELFCKGYWLAIWQHQSNIHPVDMSFSWRIISDTQRAWFWLWYTDLMMQDINIITLMLWVNFPSKEPIRTYLSASNRLMIRLRWGWVYFNEVYFNEVTFICSHSVFKIWGMRSQSTVGLEDAGWIGPFTPASPPWAFNSSFSLFLIKTFLPNSIGKA